MGREAEPQSGELPIYGSCAAASERGRRRAGAAPNRLPDTEFRGRDAASDDYIRDMLESSAVTIPD